MSSVIVYFVFRIILMLYYCDYCCWS